MNLYLLKNKNMLTYTFKKYFKNVEILKWFKIFLLRKIYFTTIVLNNLLSYNSLIGFSFFCSLKTWGGRRHWQHALWINGQWISKEIWLAFLKVRFNAYFHNNHNSKINCSNVNHKIAMDTSLTRLTFWKAKNISQ